MAGAESASDIGLRPPAEVMRLERMGAAFQTRLSFMRSLLRRMAREDWRISRSRFELNDHGFGTAVYTAHTPSRQYSLIAYSHHLDPARRTDRVIAEAWDATFILFDGVPSDADIERLGAQAPRQEAGRYSPSELVLSRANRSVRLFGHTAHSLAEGRQPDRDLFIEIGYLMRTTAVYANGKFGLADRAKYAARPELRGPFQAEMLNVYLIRSFTFDLVEHVAGQLNPEAFVPLARRLKRYLGIGNATGLGMAPFLVSHPTLIHNWFSARETALARVRSLPRAEPARIEWFQAVLARARDHVREWRVEDELQTARIEVLRAEIDRLGQWLAEHEDSDQRPWDRLYRRAAAEFSLEGQELLVSLLMEPYPDLVDELADCLAADPEPDLDPAMTAGALARLLGAEYDWALAYDFDDPGANRYVWYYSDEKFEPRRGEQRAEIAEEQAMTIAVARDIQSLRRALAEEAADTSLAALLMRRPDLRHAAHRAQIAVGWAYSEIRENLIGEACRPVDILRAKLAYFGATKFDPKSDLWTRITMYQGAPLADEIVAGEIAVDEWCFPSLADTKEAACGSP